MRYSIKPVLAMFIINSCISDVEPDVKIYNDPTSFDQLFQTFWVKMETGYAYWDYDTVNWSNVYRKYKHLFQNLHIDNRSDVEKSIGYIQEMTANLIDSHYYMDLNFENFQIRKAYNPALNRKQRALTYRPPYDYSDIVKTYLDSGFKTGKSPIASENLELLTLSGTIDGHILYFKCNSFYLLKAYASLEKNDNKEVLDYFFDQIQNRKKNIEGIIIDLRDNSGGELADLNFLLGNFIGLPLNFGYTRYKFGNDKYDFTPWVKAVIYPSKEGKNFDIPIIVGLIDNFTVSTAELAAIAIKSMPFGILIGESSYGATGPVTLNEIYNSGSFTISNFMKVQMASAAFKALNNEIYEGKGFEPTIIVPFNFESLSQGRDLQIEKAISVILDK